MRVPAPPCAGRQGRRGPGAPACSVTKSAPGEAKHRPERRPRPAASATPGTASRPVRGGPARPDAGRARTAVSVSRGADVPRRRGRSPGAPPARRRSRPAARPGPGSAAAAARGVRGARGASPQELRSERRPAAPPRAGTARPADPPRPVRPRPADSRRALSAGRRRPLRPAPSRAAPQTPYLPPCRAGPAAASREERRAAGAARTRGRGSRESLGSGRRERRREAAAGGARRPLLPSHLRGAAVRHAAGGTVAAAHAGR